MFNKEKIQSSLFGVVGFNDSFNPDYQILDTANQESRSGYFATDNSLVSVELLLENQEYAEINDTDFNITLKRLQESSIASVCNEVFNRPSYRERNPLYQWANNKITTETLPDGFIGVEIQPSQAKNLGFKISRVLLDFSGTGDIELRLYNSAKFDPLFTKNVSITSERQEVDLNWVINNTDLDFKGKYYLGYVVNQSVLPFKLNYENSSLKTNYKDLCVQEIIVKGYSGINIFNLKEVENTSLSTGLNPDITVFDDYTDLIIQNEMLFARAINLDLQIRCLRLIADSIRSNRDQRKGEEKTIRILQEIEGQSGDGLVTVTGLLPSRITEIASLRKEIKKLIEGYFGSKIIVNTLW